MYRILLVEDEIQFRGPIAAILRDSCTITSTASIAEAKAALEKSAFDLVLLDVGLPDGNGISLCSFLQHSPCHVGTPVVFLTGASALDSKLLAFSAGADDYILKPFDSRELRARVLGRLAKESARKSKSRELQEGDLRFCVDTQKLFVQTEVGEQKVDLTGIEFKLLFYFATRCEHVLARDQLMSAVWGPDIFLSDRTIDSHISRLRKKIARSRCEIRSVHGEGYRFCSSTSASGKSAAS